MRTIFAKYGKRGAAVLLVLAMALSLALCGCGSTEVSYADDVETRIFTDSAGREVEVPTEITRVAPSGAVSQMILITIAPEKLVGLSSTPTVEQRDYIPEYLWTLPTFGQFYGSKANLNMEALIAADPQIIIDLGDRKDGIEDDMDTIQKQTGIATVFIEADLYHLETAYEMLGDLLGCEEDAQVLADYVHDAMAMCEENSAKIAEEDRVSVMYGTGSTGLACNAAGSTQCYVIDLVGADNAIVVPEDELSNKGGGNQISLEQLYIFDPDVLLFMEGGPYDTIGTSEEWADLTAVKNDAYYEIPGVPYCWLSNPPSVNQVIGLYWLGNLLYPDIYDYDMVEVTKEFYHLFWHTDITTETAEGFLANSTLKAEANRAG